MATELTATQSANSRTASVAAAHTLDGGFLIQIDDEIQLVEKRGNQIAQPWQVQRGMFGTTKAQHDSGADVTVVIPQFQTVDPPPATGDTGSPFTPAMVGPYRVHYNDAGADFEAGVELVDLDEGTIVLMTWVEVITPFIANGENSGFGCALSLGPGRGNLCDYYPNFGPSVTGAEAGPAQVTKKVQKVGAGGETLIVFVYQDVLHTITAGVLDAYAVIVPPS